MTILATFPLFKLRSGQTLVEHLRCTAEAKAVLVHKRPAFVFWVKLLPPEHISAEIVCAFGPLETNIHSERTGRRPPAK